jgi:hypothetical protein
MLRYEIAVRSPADEVLDEGLPELAPVLAALGPGALLIGGLSSAAWLSSRPVGLPVRATRDVDLGIDRPTLGITRDHAPIRPLLDRQRFTSGFGGEEFRFSLDTTKGPFVVDLLVAAGASRESPPVIERGLPSLAAPGLAYAIDRGAVPLQLVLRGPETRTFDLFTVQLDAAFVMKAALVAGGMRPRRDKRIVDTADAVMLAAACAADGAAMSALAHHRRRSEPKRAISWLADELNGPRSAAARRMAEHTGTEDGARWAVDTAGRFAAALAAAGAT